MPLNSPKKILAMKLRSMGDTILMTAPLTELHQAFPDAEIHVTIQTPWAPLLEGFPGITKIWTYDRHADRASRAKAVARLAYRLRKEHFDCAINFHASPSSAMIAFATGAPLRAIHFHGHRDKNLYSTTQIAGKGQLKPVIERDMDTIRSLGLNIPEGRFPVIHVSKKERNQSYAWLQRLNMSALVVGSSSSVLGIGLGASRPTKSWSVENFAKLAIAWCSEERRAAFAFAGPQEAASLERFLKAVDEELEKTIPNPNRRASIRGRIAGECKLPLRELASILSQLNVYAGNDSGPKHLAVAVGTPTVTVFGPEDPFEWHPYPTDRHPYFFTKDLPCRKDAEPGFPQWCGLSECIDESHRCMTGIEVEPVLKECLRVAKK